MMSIKLDTGALENLLKDDDGTIKLELQQAVLEEFSRRHIKSVINDHYFKAHIDAVSKEAVKEVEKLFGEWKGSYSKKQLELNPQIKDMVKLQAKTAVTHELDQVENHVREIYRDTAKKIRVDYTKKAKDLQETLNYQVKEIFEGMIDNSFDNVLRNHIKSIMAETFALN